MTTVSGRRDMAALVEQARSDEDFADDLQDRLNLHKRQAAQAEMIRDSRQGWKTFVIIGFVLMMIIMVSLQRAFKVPVYDVMARDRAYVEATYGRGKSQMAKGILLVMLAVIVYGIYVLFRRANYDFSAFLLGGEQAKKRSNQFNQVQAKQTRRLEREVRESRRQEDRDLREVDEETRSDTISRKPKTGTGSGGGLEMMVDLDQD